MTLKIRQRKILDKEIPSFSKCSVLSALHSYKKNISFSLNLIQNNYKFSGNITCDIPLEIKLKNIPAIFENGNGEMKYIPKFTVQY